MTLRSCWWLVLTILGVQPIPGISTPHTRVTLLSDKAAIAPGDSFHVGIYLEMEEGWHTYFKKPVGPGLATSVEWKLPSGFTAGDIQWPKPKAFSPGGITSYGYENDVLLMVPIQSPSQGIKPGEAVTLHATVRWLECKELCIPESMEWDLQIPVQDHSMPGSPETVRLFDRFRSKIVPADYNPETSAEARSSDNFSSASGARLSPENRVSISLWKIMAFAFLGGLILNVMPCVLPVLAIKVMSFVKQSGQSARQSRILGWMYGLGVLVSFWILAGIVTALQAGGIQVGWGFQFQDSRFVMLMALVVTLVTLNLFGGFEMVISPKLLSQAGSLTSARGIVGAFFSGVLATLLSTPCTAPFLAQAVGFAFTQEAKIIFLIFTMIGIGLAWPYIFLTHYPSLLRFIPKPGAWMLHFKHALGFPMIATALWLVSILRESELAVALWLVAISFAVWLTHLLTSGRLIWLLAVTLGLSSFAYNQVGQKDKIEWIPYSQAALQKALQSDRPVYVDFTADWCLTCQQNRLTSLENPEVVERFRRHRVIALLGDWTRPNEEITQALRSFGKSGVPVNVVYPVDRSRPPIILNELLTPGIVLTALDEAVGKSPSQSK